VPAETLIQRKCRTPGRSTKTGLIRFVAALAVSLAPLATPWMPSVSHACSDRAPAIRTPRQAHAPAESRHAQALAYYPHPQAQAQAQAQAHAQFDDAHAIQHHPETAGDVAPIIPLDLALVPVSAHPDYTRQFPGVFLRQGPPLRRVALTFDDGPDNVYTPQILQILAKERIHATFFVLGEQVERYPNMLRRIARGGHLIGNHTYDHRDLTGLSPQALRWEIGRAQVDITRTIGHSTHWFRAPYGNVDSQVIRTVGRMGYQAINWTVDSRDWRSLPKRQIERNILSAVFPGAIILQHCSGNSKEVLTGTVQALPVIIHTLRRKGYEFVTVAQLLAPETRAVHAR